MILNDEETNAIAFSTRLHGIIATTRAIEAAVIAKLAAGVSVEPAYWRNQVDSYSVLSSEDKEKNSFQYSDEFLEGHTDPLYTADQLKTTIAAARVQALEDAAVVCERTNTYGDMLGGWLEEIAKTIRALKGGV